jgi:hypothetical protein
MEYLVPERQPRSKDLPYRGHGRVLQADTSFPSRIDDNNDLDQFIKAKVQELGTTQNTEASLEKTAFLIIHYCKLTPKVMAHLRQKFLPSFSNVTWTDVYPFFANSLDTHMYSDHRSIQTYKLYRSRIPTEIFQHMCRVLNRSRKNLGDRCTLENEAAVQLYMNPIPETIISLFCGRLTNTLEHMFHGRIAGSERCEFTITFHGQLTLLFIELESLSHNAQAHSKIVAQVMAEADEANLFNEEYRFDGIPIRAILTDGIDFEFYFFDFKTWSVQRGIGSAESGIPWHTYPRVSLPPWERASDYLAKLKIVTEVIFDEFIDSYIVGLEAQLEHSSAELSFQTIPNIDSGVIGRESTGYWERAYAQAQVAG